MSSHCLDDGNARYAIKQAAQCNLQNDSLLVSTLHLALEAKYLGVFDHPNIIKMWATANIPSAEKEFFIVLDRLYGTLRDQLKKWKYEKRSVWRKGKERTNDFKIQRLHHCCCLASAMKYVHEKKYVQEQIGLIVKLFRSSSFHYLTM